jgi:hypothetical protein
MSEENENNQEPTEEPKPIEQTDTISRAQAEQMARDAVKSAKSDLVKQIKELKAQNSQLTTATAEAEKQKAIESENFKSLYEQSEASRLEIQNESATEINQLRTELIGSKLKAALPAHITSDDIAFKGYLLTYNDLGDDAPSPTDWVAQLAAENPEKFEVRGGGVRTGNGSAGGVSQGGGSNQSLEARLKSDDMTVRKAALEEQLANRLG